MDASPRTLALLVVAGAILAAALFAVRPERPEGDPGAFYALAGRNGAELVPAIRGQGLNFDPAVSTDARQRIADAITHARPEAQRLIALVDGLATVRVGPTPSGSLGVTEGNGEHFDVTLDLYTVLRENGERGVARLVLHELGHVIDYAIVPSDLDTRLAAGIPLGYSCVPGEPTSACAPREERFAETFAKWATGDIGINLNIGYQVLPPSVDLDTWGAPLAALGA